MKAINHHTVFFKRLLLAATIGWMPMITHAQTQVLLNETFSGTTMPGTLVGGGATGAAQTVNNGDLILTTPGTGVYQRSYIRTTANDLFAIDEGTYTYSFSMPTGHTTGNYLNLALVAGSGAVWGVSPDYQSASVLGITLQWRNSTNNWEIAYWSKDSTANSNVIANWSVDLANLANSAQGTQLGFSIDTQTLELTVFAGDRSVTTTLTEAFLEDFNGNAYLMLEGQGPSTNTTRTWYVSDVYAAVTAIPEPASAAVFTGFAALLAMGISLRKRRAQR